MYLVHRYNEQGRQGKNLLHVLVDAALLASGNLEFTHIYVFVLAVCPRALPGGVRSIAACDPGHVERALAVWSVRFLARHGPSRAAVCGAPQLYIAFFFLVDEVRDLRGMQQNRFLPPPKQGVSRCGRGLVSLGALAVKLLSSSFALLSCTSLCFGTSLGGAYTCVLFGAFPPPPPPMTSPLPTLSIPVSL